MKEVLAEVFNKLTKEKHFDSISLTKVFDGYDVYFMKQGAVARMHLPDVITETPEDFRQTMMLYAVDAKVLIDKKLNASSAQA